MILLLLKKFSKFFAEDGSLLQDQGPYGTDGHFDGKDDPSAFSLAIVCSQLHESYEPGQFGLNAAAIHWILHSGLGAIFSGLERLVLPSARDPKVADIMSKYQGQIRDIQIQTAKMQPHNKVSKTEAQEELRKGYRPDSKKSTTKVSFVS